MADDNVMPEHSSLQDNLEGLKDVVGDLADSMQSQREALKEHGITMPAGVMAALDEVGQLVTSFESDATGLARELERFRALADTAALVNSTLDLSQVLNEVMDQVVKLTEAERGYLMLRDEFTGELTFRVARNMDRETLAEDEFMVSRSIVSEVAETGEAVVTTNAQADPRFSTTESIVGMNLISILCVPLVLKDQVMGVIYADHRIHEGLFGPGDRDLLNAFANQAAIAIQNAQLFESVLEMKNLQDDIFASITSGVITTDMQENVTLINRAAEEILQLGDVPAAGARLVDILPPLDARFGLVMDEVREQEHAMHAIEFEPDVPERGLINLSFNLSPLKDADSATQGIAIVLNDLTDQKRREAQLAGVRRYLPSEVVDGLTDVDALKLGGTRQEVSVVFADIRGFSTFSEHITPEQLVEVINTYFTIASDAIHLQEGVIDKFMGDAVMALFNPSIRPQEDHALRAVRAALAIRSDIGAFHETIPEEDWLQFGIGVHTGVAVTGNVGSPDRLDYSALGDTVNLSKRLQEGAEPTQILISESTYEQVKGFFQVQKLEPIQVKGRSQYTQVYEVLAVKV